MEQEHIEQLQYMCRMYGVYEVTKAISNYAKKTSKEYHSLGNHGAIIHSDASKLSDAVMLMKLSHALRLVDESK